MIDMFTLSAALVRAPVVITVLPAEDCAGLVLSSDMAPEVRALFLLPVVPAEVGVVWVDCVVLAEGGVLRVRDVVRDCLSAAWMSLLVARPVARSRNWLHAGKDRGPGLWKIS